MSRVLDQGAFVAWFDKFMPPAHSNKFKPLRTVSLDAVGTGRRGGGRGQRGAGTTNEDPAQAAAAPPAAAQPPPARSRPRRHRVPRRRRLLRQLLPVRQAASVVHRLTRRLPIRNLVQAGRGGGRGGPPASPRATWTGLAFTRADAYSRLAAALPANDPRVPVYKRLAAIHGEIGQRGLGDPAAFDAPWLGSFAVSYLTTTGAQPGTGARSER